MTISFVIVEDSLSSELHRHGVGAVKLSAKINDPKHGDIFWQKSLLGHSSPKVLQRTLCRVHVQK